jgi:hypothetical protein
MQECPHEYFHKEAKTVYVKAKTHLYDLSPYDETIFLDADTIMLPLKSIADTFVELKDLDFTMENRGRVNLAEIRVTDTYLWATIPDVISAYKFTKGFLYGLHSEFIYFKKNDRVKKYFDTVKQEFSNPHSVPMAHVFDGDIPDEFAFAMAMIKHEMYPHTCPYIPLYWYLTDNHLGTKMSFVNANFLGYSIGGNKIPETARRNYDRTAAAAFQRLGIRNPYQVKQKKQFAASRTKM